MKLRSRINLYTTVMFISLLLLIDVAIYMSFSRMLLNSELEKTVAETVRSINGMKEQGNIPTEELLRAYMPLNGMIQIVKSDGTLENAVTAPGYETLMDLPYEFYQQEHRRIFNINGIPYSFVSIPFISSNGEIVDLQYTESLFTTHQNLQILKYVLMVVSLIAAIPVFLSSRILSNFISRPISTMTETMVDIRESGEYKELSLPRESKDELYLMGETFNNMIQQLKRNYEKQEEFVSNASHELRTPLTVIESYSSLLKRRGKDQPEVFDESVRAIHSESIRMKEMIEQLLLLARHEEHWDITMESFSLREFVEQSIRSFQTAYDREILFTSEEEIIISSDKQKLKQLFYIFLDNAYKYSELSIEVRLKKNNGKAVIMIIDQGIGINKDELENVFDRFYRVDKARTRKSGGYGLGLSLAKEIADAISAEVKLESEEGKGTTAYIILEIS